MTITTDLISKIKEYKYTENAFLPKIVTIPLEQENQIDCVPLVKPGDVVQEGDVIARAQIRNRKTTYIHSSIPGVVKEICSCYAPDGKEEFAIKIQLNGKFTYLGKKLPEKELPSISPSKILNSVLDNGIINTFDITCPESLGNQLTKMNEENMLVVRLFDEDYTRISDGLVSKFYLNEIVTGAKAVAQAFSAKQIVFAVSAAFDFTERLDLTGLNNAKLLKVNTKKYPCGYKRELVTLFNKSCKKTGDFKLSKNDLFIDSLTAWQVYKAVILGIPSITTLVHFSGVCLNNSCLLNVRTGTSIKDIVNQLGGFSREPASIIINGSISGCSVASLDIPVTKSVKSVAFIPKRKTTDSQVYSCINCGNCRFICPVNISPDVIYNNTVHFLELPPTFTESTVACTGCSLCNSVCPARLPLCQTVTYIKNNHISKKDR